MAALGATHRPFQNRLGRVLDIEGIGDCSVIADRIRIDPKRMEQMVLGTIPGTAEEWRQTIEQVNLLAQKRAQWYPYTEEYLLGWNLERFRTAWAMQSVEVTTEKTSKGVSVVLERSSTDLSAKREEFSKKLRANRRRLLDAIEQDRVSQPWTPRPDQSHQIATPFLVRSSK